MWLTCLCSLCHVNNPTTFGGTDPPIIASRKCATSILELSIVNQVQTLTMTFLSCLMKRQLILNSQILNYLNFAMRMIVALIINMRIMLREHK